MVLDVEALSVGALSEVILSSHLITTPLLPLTSNDSTKTWEQCAEPNLQSTSPRSSMNCPHNIVKGHYAGFRGWGTSVLAAPAGPNPPLLPGFPLINTTVELAARWGPWGYRCVHLWLQSFFSVTSGVCAGWKMCLLKATFKRPQSKCSSLYLRDSMSLYNENMR